MTHPGRTGISGPAVQSNARPMFSRRLRRTSSRGETDEALLGRVRQKDPEALGALYERYARQVYGLALGMLRDPGAAEEITQEVFLSVWQNARTFDSSRGSFAAWVMSLAHHKAVDRLRRLQVRRTEPANETTPDAVDVVEEVVRLLESERVRKALQALPQDQREVIVLAYYGGLTQREIAQRLGIPLGTVKTRTRDGLLRLRTILSAGGEEP